jgi:hypothetical protein
VLWESFGTDESITKGELIQSIKYENGNLFIPAGASRLCFYGVAWNNKAGGFSIIDDSGSEVYSVSCVSNAGAANNPPYTIEVAGADYYEIDLSWFTDAPLPSGKTLTFRTREDATRAAMSEVRNSAVR